MFVVKGGLTVAAVEHRDQAACVFACPSSAAAACDYLPSACEGLQGLQEPFLEQASSRERQAYSVTGGLHNQAGMDTGLPLLLLHSSPHPVIEVREVSSWRISPTVSPHWASVGLMNRLPYEERGKTAAQLDGGQCSLQFRLVAGLSTGDEHR